MAGIKALYFLPLIQAEAASSPQLPFFLGLAGEFAIPIESGALAFGVGLETLRRLNGATVAGHVLASGLVLLPSEATGNALIQPWLLVAAGPLMAAVIFWGPTLGSLLGTLLAYAILEFPRAENTAA